MLTCTAPHVCTEGERAQLHLCTQRAHPPLVQMELLERLETGALEGPCSAHIHLPIPPRRLLCSSFKGHLSQDQVDIALSPGKAPSSSFWLAADKRRLCCGHILTFIRLLFIQLSAEAGLGGKVAMAQHAAFQAPPPSQPHGGGEGRRESEVFPSNINIPVKRSWQAPTWRCQERL